jgi:hypothetical protein
MKLGYGAPVAAKAASAVISVPILAAPWGNRRELRTAATSQSLTPSRT